MPDEITNLGMVFFQSSGGRATSLAEESVVEYSSTTGYEEETQGRVNNSPYQLVLVHIIPNKGTPSKLTVRTDKRITLDQQINCRYTQHSRPAMPLPKGTHTLVGFSLPPLKARASA